jgi:hypothetical protein
MSRAADDLSILELLTESIFLLVPPLANTISKSRAAASANCDIFNVMKTARAHILCIDIYLHTLNESAGIRLSSARITSLVTKKVTSHLPTLNFWHDSKVKVVRAFLTSFFTAILGERSNTPADAVVKSNCAHVEFPRLFDTQEAIILF